MRAARASDGAAMKYFRRQSDEPPHAGATFYFQVSEDFTVQRQLIVAADGKALSYDQAHASDAQGKLQAEPLNEADFSLTEIEAPEFTAAWDQAKPVNR